MEDPEPGVKIFVFYMTTEKGKGEGMGMGGDYEQSITNVTGDEPL